MSLIEVVAAIAILAIFGSSLFIMQQYLFERMVISQQKLYATLRINSELIAYQKNISNNLLTQTESIEKSLQPQTKNFTGPDMTVKINSQELNRVDIASQDNPFKKFKNVYLITAQAGFGKKEYAATYIFMYIPEVEKT